MSKTRALGISEASHTGRKLSPRAMNNGCRLLTTSIRRLTELSQIGITFREKQIGITFREKRNILRIFVLAVCMASCGVALLATRLSGVAAAANPSHQTAFSQLSLFPFVRNSSLSSNNPPTAVADTFTGLAARHQNAPGLLANDSDPDGDTLTVYTNPVTAPQHGNVTLYGSGSFNYTPSYGYVGTDTFTYKVCDSLGACSNATGTLINANSAPTAGDDTYTGLAARQQPAPGLLGNDSDPDGDTRSVHTNPVTGPQHGNVTLNGKW